jgi:phosphohistidine phosphatase
MNLYILRHGLAAERTIPGFKQDRDRPLTTEGQKKTRRTAVLLRSLGLSFDVILTSPFVRADQTATIVADVLKAKKKLKASPHLTPKGKHSDLVDELNHWPKPLQEVLLVGHEPALSRLISILVLGKPGLALELKKGGLCKLEIPTLRFGRCATLQWLLTPKLTTIAR